MINAAVHQYIQQEAGFGDGEEDQLRERLRDGSLKKARLRLAAQMGYPVAVTLVSNHFGDEPGTKKWWNRLASLDKEAAVRGALALASPLCSLWEQAPPRDKALAERAYTLSKDWVAIPSTASAAQARGLGEFTEDPTRSRAVTGALWTSFFAALCPESPTAVWDAASSYDECLQGEPGPLAFPAPFEDADDPPSAADLVALAITPWALGYFDPLL